MWRIIGVSVVAAAAWYYLRGGSMDEPAFVLAGKGWKARSGALVPAGLSPWLDQLAARWGRPLEITSGLRTPAAQAKAMTGLVNAGTDPAEMLRLYGGTATIKAVVNAAYVGGRWSEPMATAILTSQAGAGIYLSQHMTGRAVDISIRDLSESEQEALRDLARQLGASANIETEPLHLHVQAIPVSRV